MTRGNKAGRAGKKPVPGNKLLIVTDAWYPQVNGVVRTLTHTKSCLEAEGWQVVMLTPQSFRTIPCPTYPEIRLSLLPAAGVAKIMRTEAPDRIHIATEGPLGLAARNYALRHELDFTTAYHTRFPEYVAARTRLPLSITYRFMRWFHAPSSALLAPTQSVIDDLQKWQTGKPVLWPRGVDLELFSPDRNRVPNKQPIFLYVGRVAVEKNLEAFLSLDLEGEKWVVGGGPALAALKQKYPAARFFGMKDKTELPAFYQQADVFVFPSRTDTFGLVLLEAMGCGLPVAAFPVTGPKDVVGHSEAGSLDTDLAKACRKALTLDREKVRAHAASYSWQAASRIFASHLIPARQDASYNILDNPHKHNLGLRRALAAARHSFSGLRFALYEESAFRQELLLACILVPLAFWLAPDLSGRMLLIGSVLLVLIVELLNSSVEAAIDRISMRQHGLSRRAKDYGSAAVMLALLLCGAVYASAVWQLLAG